MNFITSLILLFCFKLASSQSYVTVLCAGCGVPAPDSSCHIYIRQDSFNRPVFVAFYSGYNYNQSVYAVLGSINFTGDGIHVYANDSMAGMDSLRTNRFYVSPLGSDYVLKVKK